MSDAITIGVLALQGDYERHLALLAGIGVDAVRVRREDELAKVDGLILPGGESTTLHTLLRRTDLYEPLSEFASDRPILGTCAGLILMASELENAGGVEPLGILTMKVQRNGFGRQIDSFEADLEVTEGGPRGNEVARGVFIRAPRILDPAENEILARWQGEPVAIRQGAHVALSFHPELLSDPRWHQLWLAGVQRVSELSPP